MRSAPRRVNVNYNGRFTQRRGETERTSKLLTFLSVPLRLCVKRSVRMSAGADLDDALAGDDVDPVARRHGDVGGAGELAEGGEDAVPLAEVEAGEPLPLAPHAAQRDRRVHVPRQHVAVRRVEGVVGEDEGRLRAGRVAAVDAQLPRRGAPRAGVGGAGEGGGGGGGARPPPPRAPARGGGASPPARGGGAGPAPATPARPRAWRAPSPRGRGRGRPGSPAARRRCAPGRG